MPIAPAYTDIVYFLEVAATQNISRAAERLGITQPSLSLAMKRLEDALQSTLLTRGRTGVQLTKAGKELLGRGRLLLLNWEQLRADVRRQEHDVTGQYVIGCHPSVALYALNDFLPRLIQAHPDLEIKLVHDLSRKITESTISFEIDFGIVVNPIRHPDLVIVQLATDDVLLWTAAEPSVTQTLCPKMGVLICDFDLIQTQKSLENLQKLNFGFRRTIQSSNLEVIAELTAAGTGIGVLPRRVATRNRALRLKPLNDKLPVVKDRICLVYRADSHRTKARQTIIDAIVKMK